MKITGEPKTNTVPYSQFGNYENQEITVTGTVHNIRMMSDFAFVILRTARETIQCVYAESFSDYRMPAELKEECAVKLTGKVVAGETRDGGKRYELQIHDIEILSYPADIPPVVITKKQVQCDLNTDLDYRPVTLRNPKERAVFKFQEGIQRGFREYLMSQGFTEIHSPKINFAGAEGGTNVFKLDYFGKQVYLAQSPQLYKQALVAVYERVFEIAPVFEDANIASDHNMLIMNLLHDIAPRHDFLCLLHEKPFAGVNGSGKHNNWSLSDSDGNNLLDPGVTPLDNAQFLVFLAAVLRAVHRHADVLRLGTIGAGNDHRLGANEAPPAIISVYLGEQLSGVIDTIVNGVRHENAPAFMEIGVSSLPPLPVDLSDRNRTSPFAFTGNKFEFRAVGSSQPIAPVNIALNTAMACALDDIATQLEAAVREGASLKDALQELLPRLFREHQNVVFNGNGYADSWPVEAERRGLLNLANTVDALERYDSPEVMNVFLRQNVLSEREMLARQDILLDNYAKNVSIEGAVMLEMIRTRVLPAALSEQSEAAELVARTRAVLGEAEPELERFSALRRHASALAMTAASLEENLAVLHGTEDLHTAARAARDGVLPAMQRCREHCDALERMISAEHWPLPSYAEMLWMH